jgi:hypothetical protein
MEYQSTTYFGLNFQLRSKVYSNMHPYMYMHMYVAALEHAYAVIITWVWLRFLLKHGLVLQLFFRLLF